MTIMDMLEQSGVLALLGMGIVFAFLAIVIIAVTIMGKLLGGASGAPAAQAAAPVAAAPVANQADTVAAITAAVTEYRKSK
jgi:oxaloacetate decarboxylase gamma subunit